MLQVALTNTRCSKPEDNSQGLLEKQGDWFNNPCLIFKQNFEVVCSLNCINIVTFPTNNNETMTLFLAMSPKKLKPEKINVSEVVMNFKG